MKVNLRIDHKQIAAMNIEMQKALIKTADAMITDLVDSQTMPMDTGVLQNDSTGVSKKRPLKITISSNTPYARRLYFHPEFNFRKDKNPKAGAEWFKPYIEGNKKRMPARLFKKFMEGKI